MIQINNREITPFGGIHLVHKEVMAKGLAPLIHDELGERNDNAQYSYSDLILNMSYTAFCGGDCAEDINYVNSTFQYLKGLKTPSPDCILNMQKELSTPAEEVISDSGIVNKVNVNYRMNRLLVKTAVHLEQLQPKQSKNYCLDFDHQFIPTEKYDATYSYKGQKGYFPGVASIDNIPVYIENRNGNCNVMLQQLDTLQRTFSLLSENDIQPARCRMDSGSYIKEVCDWLHANDITFYIRANQSEQLLFEASLSDDWNKCVIGVNEYEVCSIEHKFGKYTHRVVVYRWPNKTGQVSAITADANCYLFIITSDRERDEKNIIEYYNQRGNSERLFDIQNNDFNWKKMPFSFLEQNTVYLLIMAICHIMYKWLIGIFSKACSFLQAHHRLKKFTFRLICIAAKVIRSGRRQVVKLFTGNVIKYSGLSP